MASEMKNFETFDQFLDATQDLLFPIPQGEKKSDYHGEGWNACYARMKEITEELKKEKEQRYEDNEKARRVICEISKQVEEYEGCMPDYYGKATPGDIEEVVENLKDEIDETAEELEAKIKVLKEKIQEQGDKLIAFHAKKEVLPENASSACVSAVLAVKNDEIKGLREELACVTSQRDTFGDMIKSKN